MVRTQGSATPSPGGWGAEQVPGITWYPAWHHHRHSSAFLIQPKHHPETSGAGRRLTCQISTMTIPVTEQPPSLRKNQGVKIPGHHHETEILHLL